MEETKDTQLLHLIDPDGRFAPIIAPIVEDMGYRLIKVGFNGHDPKRGSILAVMIEPLDGSKLKIDACKTVSNAISANMDVEDPINDSYVLEVGSAGLDRPLTDKRDFGRFKGFEAKIECKRADENDQRKYRGFIEGTDENGVTIKTVERGSILLQWQNLSSARMVASDDLLKALQSNSI
jgi:ribosome maturation factor RimP